MVEVPAAEAHLASLQRVGTVVVEQIDGGMQQLVTHSCGRRSHFELIVAIVSRHGIWLLYTSI